MDTSEVQLGDTTHARILVTCRKVEASSSDDEVEDVLGDVRRAGGLNRGQGLVFMYTYIMM